MKYSLKKPPKPFPPLQPISIIIPVSGKTHLSLLDRTLRAANKADEIIVVCLDGEERQTDAYQKTYAIPNCKLVLSEQSFGRCLARNIGAQHAQNDYLVFLNADVVLHPQSLNFLSKHRKAVCTVLSAFAPRSGFRYREIWQSGGFELLRLYAQLEVRPGHYGGCIGIPRELFFDVGGFDERYDGAYGYEHDALIKILRARGTKWLNLSNKYGLLNLHQWHAVDRTNKGANKKLYKQEQRERERQQVVPDALPTKPAQSAIVVGSAGTLEEIKQVGQIYDVAPESDAELHPSLSVVVAVDKRRDCAALRRCLDSCHRQLGIDWHSVDITVALGKGWITSEAAALELCRNYGDNVAVSDDGVLAACNKATRQTRGAVVAFVDASSVLHCESFSQALRQVAADTCGYFMMAGVNKEKTDVYQASDPGEFSRRAKSFGVTGQDCWFVPRRVLESVGGWAPGLEERLKKSGYRVLDLSHASGIINMQQKLPRRAMDGSKSAGPSGVPTGVSVLVTHHPLRPAELLHDVLVKVGEATSSELTIDLYVQGPCQLPSFGDVAARVNVIQKDKNMGMYAARAEAIENMLSRNHAYWGMVDDNALISKGSIDAMAAVLDYETENGEYNVGCVQMANNRNALPVALVLCRETEQGCPVLNFERCANAARRHGEHQWGVGDVVGSGHSLYKRAVFENGVFPDDKYFMGLVDYDMCLQMHTKGFCCALLTTKRAEKIKKGCYSEAYRKIRRNKAELWRSAGIFQDKWGFVLRELNPILGRKKKCR